MFLRYDRGVLGTNGKQLYLDCFVKSNDLCIYYDNELVSPPQDHQLNKYFCSRSKCVLK